MKKNNSDNKIVVIGGCGHIGLPLCIKLAENGYKVVALDKNEELCSNVNAGIVPFIEEGAPHQLKKALETKNFYASGNYEFIRRANVILICIGTPVDEHLSPMPRLFLDLISSIEPFLSQGQLIILRSTVYPGTSAIVAEQLKHKSVSVAYCPERIVQGKALVEFNTLPQIVSAFDPKSLERARSIFENFGEIVIGTVHESEFAKLFLNAFRYIEFAITNQFFMIANDAGVDYSKVLHLMKYNYERAKYLPSPGFSGGPCLIKDTLQLVAHSQNKFSLGSDAFFVNEGLALYVVNEIKRFSSKKRPVIGLLGMAFKAEIDDIRSSLSYRVKKSLQLSGFKVLTSDPYVTTDKNLGKLNETIENSDIIVICTPHHIYKVTNFQGKKVIDIWNLLGHGSRINLGKAND